VRPIYSGFAHAGIDIGLVDSWVDYSFYLGLWAFSLGWFSIRFAHAVSHLGQIITSAVSIESGVGHSSVKGNSRLG
jgi:hypothetical protein